MELEVKRPRDVLESKPTPTPNKTVVEFDPELPSATKKRRIGKSMEEPMGEPPVRPSTEPEAETET